MRSFIARRPVAEDAPGFYKTVNDAAEKYPDRLDGLKKGQTKVWYASDKAMRDYLMGVEFCKEHDIPLPKTEADLKKTHVLIGQIAEKDLDRIFTLMQGEVWSPEGEARQLIRAQVGHTSMSVGDVIQIGKNIWMVDSTGFEKLNEGKQARFQLLTPEGPVTEAKGRIKLPTLRDTYREYSKQIIDAIVAGMAKNLKDKIKADGAASSSIVGTSGSGTSKGDLEANWSIFVSVNNNPPSVHIDTYYRDAFLKGDAVSQWSIGWEEDPLKTVEVITRWFDR